LISDSGTPGLSDPGNKLISVLVSELISNLEIIPIPGASAIISAASICGFPMDKFVFLGFPPHKKGRQKFFKEVAEYKYPVDRKSTRLNSSHLRRSRMPSSA